MLTAEIGALLGAAWARWCRTRRRHGAAPSAQQPVQATEELGGQIGGTGHTHSPPPETARPPEQTVDYGAGDSHSLLSPEPPYNPPYNPEPEPDSEFLEWMEWAATQPLRTQTTAAPEYAPPPAVGPEPRVGDVEQALPFPETMRGHCSAER